jgi:hypothetical protein
MPSYAAQLSPEDRWLIITYIREKLQQLVEPPPGTPDTPPPAPAAPTDGAAPVAPEGAAAPPPPAATGSEAKP